MKLRQPQSIFDDAVTLAAKQNDGNNELANLLNAPTVINFKESSPFLQLLFNSNQLARRSIYSKKVQAKSGIESILQEQLRTVRSLFTDSGQVDSLKTIFSVEVSKCLENLQSYDAVSEIDAIMSFIPETAVSSLSIGSPLVNFEGKIQIALGLSDKSDVDMAFARNIYPVQNDETQFVQV